MTDYDTKTQVTNRINAMNNVHKLINELFPLLNKDLVNNGYKAKACETELFERDRKRIKAIIDSVNKDDRIHVYIRYSKYSGICLNVKISYQVAEYGANYYTRDMYIQEDEIKDKEFYTQPIHDINEVLPKIDELRDLQEEQTKINSQVYTLKSLLYGR